MSTDAKIWLENDYGNYYLWDFDEKTTEAIKMPSDFEETSYLTSKSIYINPDHLGFYMKSDDEIYSYLFAENTFQNFTLPFGYPENCIFVCVLCNWTGASVGINLEIIGR